MSSGVACGVFFFMSINMSSPVRFEIFHTLDLQLSSPTSPFFSTIRRNLTRRIQHWDRLTIFYKVAHNSIRLNQVFVTEPQVSLCL